MDLEKLRAKLEKGTLTDDSKKSEVEPSAFVPGTEIRKPKVKLTGRDGNAYSIMARVVRALRKAGVPGVTIEEYKTRSKAGNYDNLIAVVMDYADVN